MTSASLDDWDRIVWQYGAATKHRSADVLLGDMTADFRTITIQPETDVSLSPSGG